MDKKHEIALAPIKRIIFKYQQKVVAWKIRRGENCTYLKPHYSGIKVYGPLPEMLRDHLEDYAKEVTIAARDHADIYGRANPVDDDMMAAINGFRKSKTYEIKEKESEVV